MDGTAFGFPPAEHPATAPEAQNGYPDASPAPAAGTQTLEPPGAPQGPAAGTPATPPQAPSPQGWEPAPPPADVPQDHLYAGRYRTWQDFENGYKSIQALETRTRAELLSAQRESEQLRAALNQALPFVQMAAQQQQPQGQPAPVETPIAVPSVDEDPQGFAAAVAAQAARESARAAEQATAQAVAQMNAQQQAMWAQQQQQAQQAQVMDAFNRSVTSFRGRHPEIAMYSPEEQAINGVAQTLQLPLTDPDEFEFAYQAWAYPQLQLAAQQLAGATGSYAFARTQQGRDLVRAQAGFVRQTAPNGQPPAQRRGATVETGGNGVPAASAPGADPVIQEILSLANAQRSVSPLFGGRGAKPS